MAKRKTKRKNKRSFSFLGITITVVLSFFLSASVYVFFLASATQFSEKEKIWLIASKDADRETIASLLQSDLKPLSRQLFNALSLVGGYWEHIHPGRYIIPQGSSLYTIFRKLKGGKQDAVRLTIKKMRTTQQVSEWVSIHLDCSKTELDDLLLNDDSLKQLGVDRYSSISLIIPNTYDVYWTTSARGFLERMKKESERFWNKDRMEKLSQLGITKIQAITIASIIEEETNDNKEKPLMASVYLNRYRKGMPLGADPTVKFALQDFSIRRVTLGHIQSSKESPYNTYKRKGIPPGPICTPSPVSIDAVLQGKKTEYLYFCAKPDFSGSHNFAVSAEEHFGNARKYRKALDSLGIQ